MKLLNKIKLIILLLIILLQFIFIPPQAYAANAVSLGTATSFSVLGGTTVTNTGSTVLNGDLGISPGNASSVTGFTFSSSPGPGIVNGATHFADSTALQAKNDSNSAYNSLAQGCDLNLTGQDLGGLTLTPGVYCFDSSAGLTGTLTLNALGDPNAVWIFKTGTTLITQPGSSVTFINGGSGPGCNVFWQVGSSATLDTTTSFVGTIIATDNITLKTGATVNGRALARGVSSDGAVTLDTNTITPIACTLTPTPTPTSTPTPTPTPTDTPTVTPMETPALNMSNLGESSPTVGTKTCPILNYVTPTIISSKRISLDSILINWGPYSGTDKFIVQYGLENGKWLYSTKVTGFSTTLNGLPPNQPIWARIAVTNDCSIGAYGEAEFMEDPSLPNMGFAPRNNNILWFVLIGIFALFSLLVLIQRKHKYLSKYYLGKK
jgi:hypothetical protein